MGCKSCEKNRANRFDLAEFAAKRFAPSELKEKRMAICKECPHSRLNLCKQCGCVIPFKTALLNSKCPIGNW